ncbi:MAG: hypothetical protein HYX92_00415 [Chloroflexi bacterium]|nr:hypothetical protein [Chloroflexota bacterium]
MKKDWLLPILAILGGLAAQFYFAEPGFLVGKGPTPTLVGVAATLFVAVFLVSGLYLIERFHRLERRRDVESRREKAEQPDKEA